MTFTSAPILIHPDPAKPFIVETDALDFALEVILSQFGIDGLLHPIVFYSRKLTSAEINYQVYDKELLAIITTFEQWRPYLAGAQHRVQVLIDHKNLLYFTTTRTLNRRQEPLAPVEIKGQEKFEVQEVLDSKNIHGKLLYLVFWRGYSPSEATWEPAGNLVHAQDLVNRFHQRYPNKTAPSGRCRLRRG
jgi:hypothetical protein